MDLTKLELGMIATHFVGNKLRDKELKLSNKTIHVSEETKEFLLRYLLISFKSQEFFKFNHSVDLKNELVKYGN